MSNHLLEEAMALKSTMLDDRHYLHQHAEVGHNLPKTRDYVMSRLKSMGYEPKEICPCGIVATVGQAGPTILLRADMDALPLQEDTGLPFACPSGNAHACGHDMHATALLAAAQILKNHESELNGTVKLMFQPAEEDFSGARPMIEAGILESPKVDAAMALHITSGHPCGALFYTIGDMYASADGFSITIYGKGGHGASPSYCIDPINIAAQIYVALQPIISREKDPTKSGVLTIGSIHGGTANNIIPEKVEMQGTIRCYDPDVRQKIKSRVVSVAETIAALYGGRAEVDFFNGTPSLSTDGDLTNIIVDSLHDALPAEHILPLNMVFTGSEDFAEVSARVPSTFLMLGGAMDGEKKMTYPPHHPKVVFNEDALPYGATAYAAAAMGWLARQK